MGGGRNKSPPAHRAEARLQNSHTFALIVFSKHGVGELTKSWMEIPWQKRHSQKACVCFLHVCHAGPEHPGSPPPPLLPGLLSCVRTGCAELQVKEIASLPQGLFTAALANGLPPRFLTLFFWGGAPLAYGTSQGRD